MYIVSKSNSAIVRYVFLFSGRCTRHVTALRTAVTVATEAEQLPLHTAEPDTLLFVDLWRVWCIVPRLFI